MRIHDRSSNNGPVINAGQVKEAGIDAFMVKATEGTGYVNPNFGTEYRAAKAYGFNSGAYHFDHWLSPVLPQLQFFADHYGPVTGDIDPWWDLESYQDRPGHTVTLGADLSWAAVVERCKTVLYCLRAHYGSGLIYCTIDTANHLVDGGFNPATDLAVAQGTNFPRYRAKVMQYPPAAIPGLSGLSDWSDT